MKPMLLTVALLAVLAAPAAAAPSGAEPSVPVPAEIDRAWGGVDRMIDALLDVRIGGLLDAADPHRPRDPRRPDETVGDVASRGDPDFETRLHGDVARARDAARAMADRVATLLPALQRSLEEMERSVEAAAGDFDRHR